MQTTTAPPRDALTDTQVKAIISTAHLQVDVGLDLLSGADVWLADISQYLDVDGSKIDRQNYSDVHGSAHLGLNTAISWGNQRLRPYMTLTDNLTGLSARFNLGVFLPTTPELTAPDTPTTYTVDCFDKTIVLDVPIGASYRVAAGAGALASAQTVLGLTGETKLLIANLGDDKPLPADKVWALDDTTTYRRVINDLLSDVGYRAVWCDWDGYFRFDPYTTPSSRAVEWVYDAGSASTIVGEDRTSSFDYFKVPNRWVFVRDDPSLGSPTADAGIYTKTNQSSGVTSIDSRGRTISRVVRLTAADQASLVSQGDRIASEDQQVNATIKFSTGPNPLHWHFDIVSITDAALGLSNVIYQSSSWTLPLNGDDMTHEAKGV